MLPCCFMTRDYNVLARVAERYRPCGRLTYGYVTSKLHRDPVLRALLAEPGDFGEVVDLGCGRGQNGIALLEAGRARTALGIDFKRAHLETATRAGAGLPFRVVRVNLAETQTLPPCDTALMIDVLYQLRADAQLQLLRAAARIARQRLLIRTIDPDRGFRSTLTIAIERLGRRVSPNSGEGVTVLPIAPLLDAVECEGFKASVKPCWHGTPFSNVIISARLLPQGVNESYDVVSMP
jgi:SAM-dependent methyltransferase